MSCLNIFAYKDFMTKFNLFGIADLNFLSDIGDKTNLFWESDRETERDGNVTIFSILITNINGTTVIFQIKNIHILIRNNPKRLFDFRRSVIF